MKKRLTALLLILCLAVTAGACGNSGDKKEEKKEDSKDGELSLGESDDEIVADDQIADDNVVLGDYKGIEVEVAKVSVSDEDVDARIKEELEENPKEKEIKDRALKDGDIANIDYKGSVDGTEFDGGTAEGYDLEIGSGSFIDNFEEQLVGMNIGDEKDIKVTFPDDYQSEDLAGKEADFNVKLNKIIEEEDAELNDEFVQEVSEVKTVKEYKEYIKEVLTEEKTDEIAQTKSSDIWEVIIETSEIKKYPESKVSSQVENVKQQNEYYASMYGMEVDEFVESNYGMSIKDVAKENVKRVLLAEAIASAEGIEITDDMFNEEAKKLADEYAEGDLDAFLEQYEEDYIKEQFLYEKVMKFVDENAVEVPVTEKSDDADGADDAGGSED